MTVYDLEGALTSKRKDVRTCERALTEASTRLAARLQRPAGEPWTVEDEALQRTVAELDEKLKKLRGELAELGQRAAKSTQIDLFGKKR